MVRSIVVGLVVVVLVAKAVSSLNQISSHWEERTQTVSLRASSAKAYEIATDNGAVEFEGRDGTAKDSPAKTVDLVALCKAGASTSERARQALDAIEITTEGKDTDTCRFGWRWRVPQEPDWAAAVDFTLRAPKNVDLKVECHNGRVIVRNLGGKATIHTHNGQIETESAGPSLDATTDNGQITAKFSGRKVNLQSHNGRIAADLSESRAIEGEVATRNGLVEVTVGPQTACDLVTETRHGRRNSHGGKIGSGGEKLVVRSRNGAILIHGPAIDEP